MAPTEYVAENKMYGRSPFCTHTVKHGQKRTERCQIAKVFPIFITAKITVIAKFTLEAEILQFLHMCKEKLPAAFILPQYHYLVF